VVSPAVAGGVRRRLMGSLTEELQRREAAARQDAAELRVRIAQLTERLGRVGLGSLEHLAGDGWWLAAGQGPADEGSRNGNAEDSDGEVEDGHAAEAAEVAEVPCG